LNLLATKCGQNNRFDDILSSGKTLTAEILLESPYALDGRKRIVDIEIRLFARSIGTAESENTELHRIAIENKIRAQSSESDQLKDEFAAISQDIEDDPVQLTIVFLTPPGDLRSLNSEFENLAEPMLGRHKKAWIRWIEQDETGNIYNQLKQVLRSESESDISPINEYVRHTLKAFVVHIKESISPSLTSARNTTQPGDIIESAFVQLSDGKYRIDRHESTTVRVFNLDTQEYEVTKPLLRKINTERKLGIDLKSSTGREKNTRQLGRHVIKELFSQQKGINDDQKTV